MPRPGELAVALAVTFAGVAAGYAVYSYVAGPVGTGRVWTPSEIASVDVQPPPEMFEPAGTPVLVANPFDSSEIFEFPSGTSEADARDAVAGFLLERAMNRGVVGTRKRTDPKG